MTINANQSRVLGVARTVSGAPMTVEAAYSRRVILTGDASTLGTSNGRWCFVDAIRMLCRVFGDVLVVLPPGCDPSWVRATSDLCATLWRRGQLTVLDAGAPINHQSAHAILFVGSRFESTVATTCINANGWVARVNTGPGELPADCSRSNPIACLFAAALGVTEVFKIVFEVPSSTAPPLSRCCFSLWDCTESTESGPELPSAIVLPDTVLFGAGAIGNAVALLLSQLPLRGHLHVVDKQDYGEENGETCTQIEGEGWFGVPKAERLAEWLRGSSGLIATGEKAYAHDAIRGDRIKNLTVNLVLNALDDVQARHDAQELWPEFLVDGGINQIGAGVFHHRLGEGSMACTICSFELPKVKPEDVYWKACGLRVSPTDLNRELTQAEVDAADPKHRDMLAKAMREKRKICSVVSDAVSLLKLNAEKDFQPSAPFVAAISAAMMLTQTIKLLTAGDAHFPQQFLIGNLFIGPETSIETSREPKASCRCVRHRDVHLDAMRRRKTSPRLNDQPQ